MIAHRQLSSHLHERSNHSFSIRPTICVTIKSICCMCQIASLYPSRSAAALPHTNSLPFSNPCTLTSLLVHFHSIYKITVTEACDEFGRNWTMHLSDCAALTACCLMVVDPARLASYENDIDRSLYLSKRFIISIPTDHSSLLTPLSSSNGFGRFVSPPLRVVHSPNLLRFSDVQL